MKCMHLFRKLKKGIIRFRAGYRIEAVAIFLHRFFKKSLIDALAVIHPYPLARSLIICKGQQIGQSHVRAFLLI